MAYTRPLIYSTCFLLAACGGGGGGTAGTGDFRLSLTDAPVDDATHVYVQFTGVEIKPAEGEKLSFDFDTPKTIDLLALQGVNEILLDTVTLDAGRYNWIRLKVNAEPDTLDSYLVQTGGAEISLYVPSGAQTGLKLNRGFNVSNNGFHDFTIDFDLRKSVNDPGGSTDMHLKPTLRIVDNLEVGGISGTVNSAIVNDGSCVNNGNVGEGVSVYVYEGLDITPDDVDNINPDPIASAIVYLNNDTGDYEYTVAFLKEGDYTAAVTCQALNDAPEVDDSIDFAGSANVSVSAGSDSEVNF